MGGWDRFDALLVLGLALLALGLALIYVPLGVVALGAGCVLLALLGARHAASADKAEK